MLSSGGSWAIYKYREADQETPVVCEDLGLGVLRMVSYQELQPQVEQLLDVLAGVLVELAGAAMEDRT